MISFKVPWISSSRQGGKYSIISKICNKVFARPHYKTTFLDINLQTQPMGLRYIVQNFYVPERVNPFRDIFTDYDLLYYLTAIAPKLKFKVKEIPVTCLYPKTGPTPTKLSIFWGTYLMLKPLFLSL